MTKITILSFLFFMVSGLRGLDVVALGIPTVEELVQEYCRLRNLPEIDNWDFYLAYSFFRMASILQGVYKRAVSGVDAGLISLGY